MEIRQATQEDIELLLPLFDGYRRFYKQQSNIKGARHFLNERFTHNESIIFIATLGNVSTSFAKANKETAIGFTQLYPLFSSVSMERLLVLNDLYIHPDYRGSGIGKKLIDTAKALCQKTNQKGIVLQTETTNPARRLYEREGFVLDKDLQFFWANKPL